MMEIGQKDVLFPEEIIPWNEVVMLAINLRIPFRHRAKGIECIIGGRRSYEEYSGGPTKWLPFVLSEKDWVFINDHLQELPSLEFPIPLGIANEFIDKFIALKNSPNIVPSFLTNTSLNADQRQRVAHFELEMEELKRLVSERNLCLITKSRSESRNLSDGVYFSKREAVQYLDRKGLLDRALAKGCCWRDLIREPEVGELSAPTEDTYYGFSQELIGMGIQAYRKILTVRKYEAAVSQLANLGVSPEEFVRGVAGELGQMHTSKPGTEQGTEPVESSPKCTDDTTSLIQVSLPPVGGNDSVKPISSECLAVSKDDEATDEVKSLKENPATGSELASASERTPAVMKLIGMKDIMDRLGVSRPTIYNYLNPSSPSYRQDFPQPRKLNSENRWDESEFNAFVETLRLPSPPKKKVNKTKSTSEFDVNLKPYSVTHGLSSGENAHAATSEKEMQQLTVLSDMASGDSIVFGPDTKASESTVAAVQTEPSWIEEREESRQQVSEQTSIPEVGYDIMLGVNGYSPQYGLLGEWSGRKIALDLNHPHTISLFGVQGGGKSYTLGTLVEMVSMPMEHINVLPSPIATLIFHYSQTEDCAPEFTSMIHANSVDEEVRMLRERYSANPEALKDVLILTPGNMVDGRKSEYPNIEVRPIAFSASELKDAHWKFLMGAGGSRSMYMRQINKTMRKLRGNLTLGTFKAAIDSSDLSDNLKALAQTRLSFASEYIDDSQRLQDLLYPGRLIIVDLRDEYIGKDEALGLFVVMLQIFSEATYQGNAYNKLVVFDEAHKYFENSGLVSELIEIVREMRHKGTSILVASQDPPSVPVSLIELSSQIIMHKFNSPAWLKHIQKANAALGELTSDDMSHLGTGEAFVWSSDASDDHFTKGAMKIKCRPRITHHGGSTKTAVSGR